MLSSVDCNITTCSIGLSYNFQKSEFESLNECFSSIDWIDLLSGWDIDATVNVFYTKLFEGFSHFI